MLRLSCFAEGAPACDCQVLESRQQPSDSFVKCHRRHVRCVPAEHILEIQLVLTDGALAEASFPRLRTSPLRTDAATAFEEI